MCKRESSNHKCDCVFVQSIHIDPDEDGRVECFSPGAVYQGVNPMIKSPSTVRCSASSLTLNLGRISQFLMDG